MYLGSVRFFKHLILSVIALMVLVPLTCAVVLVFKSQKLSNELVSVKAMMSQSSNVVSEPQEIADNGVPGAGSHIVLPTNQKELSAEAESLDYQKLFPDLYAEPTKKVSTDEKKLVYLTFDDGPSEQTLNVLDILDKNNVKATFFVVYQNNDFANSVYKEIVKRGHTIAVHSASHNYSQIYSSVESYLEDFNKMYNHIYEQTGVKIELFRFPGGSINAYNEPLYQPIIAEMLRRGFTFHDWNVSSGDASNEATKASIYKSTVDNVKKKSKSVVLMHDSVYRKFTVQALPEVIADIKSAGYSFDKLDASVAPFIFSYTE